MAPEDRLREQEGGRRAELDRRFALFFEEHRDRAHRLAWRLCGGYEADAEDIVQEAFLRAYRALDRYDERNRFSAWFYRILVRQAANHRRWRGLRRRWNADAPGEIADPRPAPQGDPAIRAQIRAALDGLTRSQRECFVLVQLEGFSAREAAAITGKAEGTVKSHLQRARNTLRSQLGGLAENA